MKKSRSGYILIACVLLIGVSCSHHDGPVGLVGTWKLVEELVDPGNGSGTFHPVTSNKILILLSDGTFQSNQSMCAMVTPSNNPSSGIYSVDDKTIMPTNCAYSGLTLNFKHEDGVNELIVYYPCFEGCAEKYIKTVIN